MSGDSLVEDRSEDLSAREWSGRKRSGLGSAVEPSTGSATLEIGSAVGVGVVRGHYWQSVPCPSHKDVVTKHHYFHEPYQVDGEWLCHIPRTSLTNDLAGLWVPASS